MTNVLSLMMGHFLIPLHSFHYFTFMPKKFKLTGDFIPEYTVIGISSQARGYRLAIMVNEKLKLHLRRKEDFPGPGNRQELNYALYQDIVKDLPRNFYLLYNRHPEGLLVPSLKGIDAFLVIYESLPSRDVNALLSRLRQGQGIQAAYTIKSSTAKDFDLLLEDLEVHIMKQEKTAVE